MTLEWPFSVKIDHRLIDTWHLVPYMDGKTILSFSLESQHHSRAEPCQVLGIL